MSITPRRKKCKSCGKYFEPTRPMQTTCSFECALEYSKQPKVQKAYHSKAKRESRSQDKARQLKIAQSVINKYVRLRDKDLPCISCGKHHTGQYHAGHYQPMGNNQNLRFNLWNIHKQCSICNNHLSGNLAEYRKNLIEKIGLEKVELLEADHSTKKYSIEYLHRLIRVFRKRSKRYE